MTNYSRSVLKSNGLRHSKNPPVRFSFSLKIVPANIAKKLPPQRCSKSLSSRFPTSRTNGPRSLSLLKSGTHSPFGERSHTTAHTPKQGSSLLRSQCGFVLPAKSLLFHRAFIYIHFPVLCEPPSSSRGGKSSKTAVTNAVPDRFSSRFSTSRTNGPRSLSQTKASTHSAL